MPAEHIHDYHCVYIRVYKKGFINSQDLKPKASAFSNTPKDGTNLSCDWCKYCSPQSSRELIGKQKNKTGNYKSPEDFNIWRFNVGKLRNETYPKQEVYHDPISIEENENGIENLAHSIIIGEKPNNAEFRATLVKIGEWAINDV